MEQEMISTMEDALINLKDMLIAYKKVINSNLADDALANWEMNKREWAALCVSDFSTLKYALRDLDQAVSDVICDGGLGIASEVADMITGMEEA